MLAALALSETSGSKIGSSKEKALIESKTVEITAGNQIASMTTVCDKLGTYQSCAGETEDLRRTLKMKVQQIQELWEERQRNAEENIELKQKTVELKRKIEMMKSPK